MRKTNDLRGIAQRPRNPTRALIPGQEYGHLTAIKQSAGDGRYTVLRCRCGEQVIRASRNVVRYLAQGLNQACPARIIRLKVERRAVISREHGKPSNGRRVGP
jgi:hypothetical protein